MALKISDIYFKRSSMFPRLIIAGIVVNLIAISAILTFILINFYPFTHMEPVNQRDRPRKTLAPLNNRPIIGVLTQELSPGLFKDFNASAVFKSYIASSYVKFVEGAGARAVPIFIGRETKYYRKLLYSINGVLYPGGAVDFEDPDGYSAAGSIIYDYAVKMNDNNDYFPLWGTCLGFELMTYLAAGKKEHRCDCYSNNQAVPLEFTKDFRGSKLFGSAPQDIIDILANEPVTANFHQFCVTKANMSSFGLLKDWHILANNRDLDGLEFVSAIEARKYPFYSLMAHPEKNAYEWKSSKNNPHSPGSVQTMQYFANFFVDEARKSTHSFSSGKEERSSLIYNYLATYTGEKLVFEQCYFFP